MTNASQWLKPPIISLLAAWSLCSCATKAPLVPQSSTPTPKPAHASAHHTKKHHETDVPNPDGPTAKIENYGIYSAEIATSADGTVPVPVPFKDLPKIQQTTTAIPCKPGCIFGISVWVDNTRNSRPITWRVDEIHPMFTLPDGTQSDHVSKEYTVLPYLPDGKVVLWAFLQGYEYEFIPGKWTFRISIDGHVAATKVFHTYTSK